MTGELLPLAILAAGGLSAFCLGAFPRLSRFLPPLAVATLLFAGLTSLWGQSAPPGGERLLDLGGYGRFFTAFFCALTAVLFLFAHPYAERRGMAGDELYGLVLWACLGMALVAAATHWLVFFLGLELTGLSFYVLVALPRRGASSGEAGLKYFFVGALASAFVAFGIALLYAASGTLDIAGSVSGAGQTARPWALLGFACLFVGIGTKLSLVPFHLWAPDVYQGAPAPVTAFLASGSKVALFAAVLRLYLSAGSAFWAASVPVLWPAAALTVTVGNLGALTQPRAKRLLAYSSIAQMGYLLLALLGIREGGAAVALFYATVYAVMDLGAFGILGSLSPATWDDDLDVLEHFRGIGYRYPWRAAVLVGCLVSLAGLPPAAGFVGKLAVFVSVFRSGFHGLALVALASTVPAAFLYLRVAIALFAAPGSSDAIPAAKARPTEGVAGAVILALLLWLGLFPSPLLALLARVASSAL